MANQSVRQRLREDKERIEAKLAKLERVPEDRFPLGTILVFVTANDVKWHLVKKAEEEWANLKGGIGTSLDFWVLRAIDEKVGYFEIYEMKAQPQPLYAYEE